MLRAFKIVAILEGISLLLLVFVAMPLKYMLDLPEYVRVAGMAHGILFIAYIIMAILFKVDDHWPWKKFGIVALASVIPFGTFYVEKKYL
jgi:integral membrane protein